MLYRLMGTLASGPLRSPARAWRAASRGAAWPAVPVVVLAAGLALACSAPTAAPSPAPTASGQPGPTGGVETPQPETALEVVTSIAILADLARNVGGDLLEVTSIVPPGADVHSFQSTPSNSRQIGEARVIVSNGLGLDGFIDPLLSSNMPANAVHVVAADGLTPQALEEQAFPGGHLASNYLDDHLIEEIDGLIHQAEEGEIPPAEALASIEELLEEYNAHGHEDEEQVHEGLGGEDLKERLLDLTHGAAEGRISAAEALEAMEELLGQREAHGPDDDHAHDHSAGDPHFWLDPILAIHYVERIRDGLIEADPANAEIYRQNADAYSRQLRDLDQEIAETLGQVPPEHRHLVTFHDAFGYFARRYGWQVSAFVPSDATEVTPRAVIQVMERVRDQGIPAVFAEPQFGGSVLDQAARDTGVQVGLIYSDTLSEDRPTYIDMMRANAQSLAENLR